MEAYPLVFTFQDMVAGKDFVAGVLAKGRGLCELEGGLWWLTGVEPGGISDSGQTHQGALISFRNTFRSVLFDLAEGSEFEEFSSAVRSMFQEVNAVEDGRWREAAKRIRSGADTAGPFHRMEKRPFEERAFIQIMRLDQCGEQQEVHNTLDKVETAA